MNNIQLAEKVKEVINSDIDPILSSHGGKVNIKSIEDGVVTITLSGSCNNCPSAQITTETIVKEGLIKKIPEIKDVKLFTEVSDDIWNFAKKLLEK